MKSLEDRYEEMKEDPKKLRRFFNITWIVAYGMLILGFIIILWVFLQGQ
jgi:cell division septal protein FtsQ